MNTQAMPQNVFIEYLSNKLKSSGSTITTAAGVDVSAYGFNANNYHIDHNGKWDASSIQAGFHAKAGFVIKASLEASTNADTAFTHDPIKTAVKQYINIDKLVNPRNGLIKSIAFDTSKTNGLNGYIDSKHLAWVINNLLLNPRGGDPAWNYGAQLMYSFEEHQPSTSDMTKWHVWDASHKPTEVQDNHRGFWIMFIPKAATGGNDANIVLSDGYSSGSYSRHVYNLATQTKIADTSVIPTNIATTGVNLGNIALSGLTNDITVADTGANVIPTSNTKAKTHATIKYSLNDFSTNPLTDAQAKNMGFANAAAATAAGWKVAFTKAELIAFIAKGNIKRDLISAKLFANTGYGILPTEKTATKANPNFDALFTYKNVDSLAGKLKLLGEDNGAVVIKGSIGVTNGILIQLPDEFSSSNLANLGLELQITTTPTSLGTQFGPTASYKTAPIDSDADWSKLDLQVIPGTGNLKTQPNTVGKLLTLHKTHGYAFVGLRLVPIKDDKGHTNTVSDHNIYKGYMAANHTKLSDWLGFTNPDDRNGAFHSIDTSQIPTTISTDHTILASIAMSGDTRHISIDETYNGHPAIESIKSQTGNQDTNGNFDNQFLSEVEVLYSIDSYQDANGQTVKIWLNKADFTAYLNGTLTKVNNKVMNGTHEVDILTTAGRTTPNYVELDKDSIVAKWATKNTAKFIPSDVTEQKVTTADGTFKKWFDAAAFKAAIAKVVVTGDTHSYTIHSDDQTLTSATFLQHQNLKLQYSNNGRAYSDTKFDFNAAGVTWAQLVARQLFMKVVPKDPTKAVISAQSSTAHIDPSNALLTDTKQGNAYQFKTYLNINKSVLTDTTSGIKFTGTTFEFFKTNIQTGLDETHADTNHNEFSQLHIEYLYNGHWYNKADLLAEMA